MKTDPRDIDLVDRLYAETGEDPSGQGPMRADGSAEVDSEALRPYRSLLALVREHDPEIQPSPAAREALLAAAAQATRPWWERVLGLAGGQGGLRPLAATAALLLLLVGVGVVWMARRPTPGPASTTRPEQAPTTSAAPQGRAEPSLAETATAVSSRGWGKGGPSASEDEDRTSALARAEASPARAATDDLRAEPTGKGLIGRALTGGAKRETRRMDGRPAASPAPAKVAGRFGGGKSFGGKPSGGLHRRSKKAARRARRLRGGALGGTAALEEAGAPRAKALAARRPAAAGGASGRAAGASFGASVGTGAVAPSASRPLRAAPAPGRGPTSAPALYRTAQSALRSGRMDQACALFAALVRQHRSDPRRADALLGWARCELARGRYSQARRVIAQLVREYPAWRKTGNALLAQVSARQQRARRQRRAARRARARKAAEADSRRRGD